MFYKTIPGPKIPQLLLPGSFKNAFMKLKLQGNKNSSRLLIHDQFPTQNLLSSAIRYDVLVTNDEFILTNWTRALLFHYELPLTLETTTNRELFHIRCRAINYSPLLQRITLKMRQFSMLCRYCNKKWEMELVPANLFTSQGDLIQEIDYYNRNPENIIYRLWCFLRKMLSHFISQR